MVGVENSSVLARHQDEDNRLRGDLQSFDEDILRQLSWVVCFGDPIVTSERIAQLDEITISHELAVERLSPFCEDVEAVLQQITQAQWLEVLKGGSDE